MNIIEKAHRIVWVLGKCFRGNDEGDSGFWREMVQINTEMELMRLHSNVGYLLGSNNSDKKDLVNLLYCMSKTHISTLTEEKKRESM